MAGWRSSSPVLDGPGSGADSGPDSLDGPEPDGPCPSRTERAGAYQAHVRRTCQRIRVGAGPMGIGAGQYLSESDCTLWNDGTGLGAGPTTKLSQWARAGPEQDPRSNQSDSDVLGMPSGRRQPARARDLTQSQRSYPMGPDADGFILNRLEEGALGNPPCR